jgi:hypothetical protein
MHNRVWAPQVGWQVQKSLFPQVNFSSNDASRCGEFETPSLGELRADHSASTRESLLPAQVCDSSLSFDGELASLCLGRSTHWQGRSSTRLLHYAHAQNYSHSLACGRMRTTREMHRPACSRYINCCPSLCPANNSFHAHAYSHVAMISRHNSRLHSIHEHEQERDDMIYTPTCSEHSHQGKLRRPLPPALTDDCPKEVIRELSILPASSPHPLLRSGPQTFHNGLDKHLSKLKCRSVC